ncbi:hypothetical protein SUGI_0037290 [Cryptomeria japonica]|nr:hypothetical protein SUGI_0037290 [Cryptomeria japonica]
MEYSIHLYSFLRHGKRKDYFAGRSKRERGRPTVKGRGRSKELLVLILMDQVRREISSGVVTAQNGLMSVLTEEAEYLYKLQNGWQRHLLSPIQKNAPLPMPGLTK